MTVKPLWEVEHELIRQAIAETKGNIARAAERLNIGRTTLYRKMHEYGIVSDRRQQSLKYCSKMEIS